MKKIKFLVDEYPRSPWFGLFYLVGTKTGLFAWFARVCFTLARAMAKLISPGESALEDTGEGALRTRMQCFICQYLDRYDSL